MEKEAAINALAALAQATRLEAFRLLVRHEPAGLPAGELARLMGVPHNTMSNHLAVLTRVGLITVERHSRSMIYRAKLQSVRDLVIFLLEDCCSGQAALCAPLLADIAKFCAAPTGCCTQGT